MLARAERKRSRHDAPGTERKAQAQGLESKIYESDDFGKECPEGTRGYAQQIRARSRRAIRFFSIHKN